MSGAVRPERRYVRGRRCPICNGSDGDPRGAERRCHGFLSGDGYAHCSREEHAGTLKLSEGSNTYGHRLTAPCGCGTTHGEATPPEASEVSGQSSLGSIVAEYDYHDENGALVYQVVRYEPKGFRQRRPDPKGGGQWIWNLKGTRRVLYHLDHVIEADPERVVYVPEGEKDVEALEALGLVATCNPQGAGKWGAVTDCASKALKGRHVVVIADADEPGRRHAAEVEAQLRGVAASVRVIEPPRGKDATDWIKAGATVEEIEATVASAEARGAGDAPTTPDQAAPGDSAQPRIEVRLLSELAPDIIKQSTTPELDYGIEGLNRLAPLPLRSLGTLVGPTGAGKTSLAMQIAAHRARYGSTPGERQGPTVYLLFELTLAQFAARHASQLSRYTQRQILGGEMPQPEIEAALTGEHFYVVKPPRRVPDIVDYANRVLDEVAKRSPGIPLIVFDYLQRIKGAGRDIRESTSNVVDAIVDLVESRDMYGLLLSKGSRAGSRSMRDGKTHGEALVDVAAETSAIEYGSATILAITYENREGGETLDARIEITKGRFGSTGASIGMRFHGASGRWEQLAEVPHTEAEDRILAAVDREPAGFQSRNALSTAAGGNRKDNLVAIRSLLVLGGGLEERDGRIVRRHP